MTDEERYDPQKHYRDLYAKEHADGVRQGLKLDPESTTQRTMFRARQAAVELEREGRGADATLLLQVTRNQAARHLPSGEDTQIIIKGLDQLRASMQERLDRVARAEPPDTPSPRVQAPTTPPPDTADKAGRTFVTDQFADGRQSYINVVLGSMKQGRQQTVDSFPETAGFYTDILPAARKHAETLPEGERKDFMKAVAHETVERLADGETIRPARQQSESRREGETRSAVA